MSLETTPNTSTNEPLTSGQQQQQQHHHPQTTPDAVTALHELAGAGAVAVGVAGSATGESGTTAAGGGGGSSETTGEAVARGGVAGGGGEGGGGTGGGSVAEGGAAAAAGKASLRMTNSDHQHQHHGGDTMNASLGGAATTPRASIATTISSNGGASNNVVGGANNYDNNNYAGPSGGLNYHHQHHHHHRQHQPLKSTESDDDDDDEYNSGGGGGGLDRGGYSTGGGASGGGSGYWGPVRASGIASRAVSPNMDNMSEISSQPPMATLAAQMIRSKSRTDMSGAAAAAVASSRYGNLSYWKARRVLFYRNGDPFFAGVEFRFKPFRDIVSLEALLDKISPKMDLPRGARYVFSMDGDRKYNLDELEDGASYVVSSFKVFKVSRIIHAMRLKYYILVYL